MTKADIGRTNVCKEMLQVIEKEGMLVALSGGEKESNGLREYFRSAGSSNKEKIMAEPIAGQQAFRLAGVGPKNDCKGYTA